MKRYMVRITRHSTTTVSVIAGSEDEAKRVASYLVESLPSEGEESEDAEVISSDDPQGPEAKKASSQAQSTE